jgi:Spy/CpxP family protein refolding chaperone
MRTLMALVLTAAMVAPVYAQRQRGQGGRGGMFGPPSGAMLLGSEDVQKDLKLTDEQKEKYKEFSTKQREAMRELFAGGERPDREKMQEIMKKNQEEGAKFVKDNLTADQAKRLKQIGYQVGGVNVFASEDVQKELKLTDEQKEKIKGIMDQMRKDMADIRGGTGGGGGRPMLTPEQQKKMEALRKEATEKVHEVLTADQKKTWETMTGPKFEGKIQPPGGGRRRGGANG